MTDIENLLQTLTYAEKEYRRQKTELENKTNKLLLIPNGIKSMRKERKKDYKKSQTIPYGKHT